MDQPAAIPIESIQYGYLSGELESPRQLFFELKVHPAEYGIGPGQRVLLRTSDRDIDELRKTFIGNNATFIIDDIHGFQLVVRSTKNVHPSVVDCTGWSYTFIDSYLLYVPRFATLYNRTC